MTCFTPESPILSNLQFCQPLELCGGITKPKKKSPWWCIKTPFFGGSWSNKNIAKKTWKWSLRSATNVTFWKNSRLKTHKKIRFVETALRAVLINELLRINSGPKILRSCFLHCNFTFEGQITVFQLHPSHPGILAEIWRVNLRMLGKPRLRAASCTNDQRHQSSWGEYMINTVMFEGQIVSFWRAGSHNFDGVQH